MAWPRGAGCESSLASPRVATRHAKVRALPLARTLVFAAFALLRTPWTSALNFLADCAASSRADPDACPLATCESHHPTLSPSTSCHPRIQPAQSECDLSP